MRPIRRRVDAHTILGLQPGASRAEIRRAYRHRALELHPDVSGADSTGDMAALNAARDELLGLPSPTANDAGAAETDHPRPRRPRDTPAYDHAPTWDDYWAAWNDPPRRGKP